LSNREAGKSHTGKIAAARTVYFFFFVVVVVVAVAVAVAVVVVVVVVVVVAAACIGTPLADVVTENGERSLIGIDGEH